jgi:hypothetical protein
VFRAAAILLALPILVVALVAVPVGLIKGPHQWLCASVALGLTVPAGLITLLLVHRLKKLSPYGQIAGVFVGTLVRVCMGLGGGLVIFFAGGTVFQDDHVSFWFWILGVYLVTLATEMVLLTYQRA